MSSYFDTGYKNRLNRYGLDFQSRIQGEREKDFQLYLLKTIYRVTFEYNNINQVASLEHNKQDKSQTSAYLLTNINLKIPNGTVLFIVNQDGTTTPWMIWWLENLEASGYNRYIVLKMTHQITWKADGSTFTQWAYFFGPGTAKITDAIKAKAGEIVYEENDNLHMFITTANQHIHRQSYFSITENEITSAFVVKEFDFISTPGVGYISVDPTFIKDTTETIIDPTDEKSYWIKEEGDINGST